MRRSPLDSTTDRSPTFEHSEATDGVSEVFRIDPMSFQLHLRRERGVGVYLETDGLMPSQVGLEKRRANPRKWIEYDA